MTFETKKPKRPYALFHCEAMVAFLEANIMRRHYQDHVEPH
ncbi:hypothetical protein [Parahalioglobus pacificus]|nr:hypothetical protein [Halioglobus pacificus]